MSVLVLVGIGVVTGLTTVLFGFGGGFVTVPVIVWADAGLGGDAAHVAVATSSIVMVVNACVATIATDRSTLALLSRSRRLLVRLAVGGALGAYAARWAPGSLIQWAFVVYLVVTIADVLVRPGFLRTNTGSDTNRRGGIPTVLGVPIGGLAAFLGVGGSVMTVPLLRRSGYAMRTATALANPLTFVIAVPALAVFLADRVPVTGSAGVWLLGSVDLGAAAALLVGALPVIVVLRRRPPRIPDLPYALSYLALLVVVAVAMAVSAA